MADSFTIYVDTAPLLAAFAAVPEAVSVRVLEACHDTAVAIETDIHARASRAFVSHLGDVIAGIQTLVEPQGNGYRVVDDDSRMPNLPFWLEKGTHLHGKVHVAPRDFFYIAAALQVGAHQQRVAQAVADGLQDAGLGE